MGGINTLLGFLKTSEFVFTHFITIFQTGLDNENKEDLDLRKKTYG